MLKLPQKLLLIILSCAMLAPHDNRAMMPPLHGNPPMGGGGPMGMPETMSDEDFAAMVAAIEEELKKMSPEELQDLENKARESLIAEGINPDTLQPLAPGEAVPFPQQPVQPQFVPQQPTEQPVAQPTQVTVPANSKAIQIHTPAEVASLLKKLLRHLEELRKKTNMDVPLTRQLKQWKEGLDDLVSWIKILNIPEHHQRLGSKDYGSLFDTLQNLKEVLVTYEPQFTIEPQEEFENPYEILRVSQKASDEEIQEAYDTYVQSHDPATLRKQLEERGLSESEIKQKLKANRLSLATVTEAYEKISDPQIRAQTNRSISAITSQKRKDESLAQDALHMIINGLTKAIYQKKLINELEQFAKQYAPVEFEHKKKMDAEEANRRKEQGIKQTPPAVPGGSYDANYYYPGAGYHPAPGGGYYPGGNYGGYPQQPDYGPSGGGEQKQPEKRDENKPKDDKKKDKKDDKDKDKEKDGDKELAKLVKEAQKGGKEKGEKPPKGAEDLAKAFDKFEQELEKVDKQLDPKKKKATEEQLKEFTIKNNELAALMQPEEPDQDTHKKEAKKEAADNKDHADANQADAKQNFEKKESDARQ